MVLPLCEPCAPFASLRATLPPVKIGPNRAPETPWMTPAPLAGLRVAAFEARMAGPLADLIAKHGGVAVEAPALREIPLADNPAALDFADRLLRGEFHVVL